MKRVGLHIRIFDSLLVAVRKAIFFNVPFVQFFLTDQMKKKYISLDKQQQKEFSSLCQKHFETFFIHGSYTINPSSCVHVEHYLLKKELKLAHNLGAKYFILHPGSAKGTVRRTDGIDALARTLNKALKKEPEIIIVLENIAHGKKGVGGNLSDFMALKHKLDFPERVQYCVDTAHAYSYGYDLCVRQKQEMFIKEIDNTIGIENIALVHLNDTKEQLASKKDRHDIIGQGNIGKKALKMFALDNRMKHLRFLLELPYMPDKQLFSVVQKIDEWFL